ncbi:conserved protein of unknown function [Methanocaldococcus lauensis]|nr:conserved protein of unknown function [Methanocaldococcus lauensis]
MKVYRILTIIILILTSLLVMCGCVILFPLKYPDVLYKNYNVIKIENRTINGVKTAIVYQIKTNIKYNGYDLDADSKRDIGIITYYVFKNTDVDEVQIICYYAGRGRLQPYYKFKIKRKDAELSGLLNLSEKDLNTGVLYCYPKLKSLGDLWVNDKLYIQKK